MGTLRDRGEKGPRSVQGLGPGPSIYEHLSWGHRRVTGHLVSSDICHRGWSWGWCTGCLTDHPPAQEGPPVGELLPTPAWAVASWWPHTLPLDLGLGHVVLRFVRSRVWVAAGA